MPFVLIIAGVVLIVAATRNTQQTLFFLMASDLTGPNNFVFWFLSILVIGLIGYIPKMKPLSDGFLILVILVLFLRKGSGFFDMFNKQIGLTTTSSPNVTPPNASQPGLYNGYGGSSGSTGGASIGVSFPISGAGINGGIPSIFGGSQCDFFDPYCELRGGANGPPGGFFGGGPFGGGGFLAS